MVHLELHGLLESVDVFSISPKNKVVIRYSRSIWCALSRKSPSGWILKKCILSIIKRGSCKKRKCSGSQRRETRASSPSASGACHIFLLSLAAIPSCLCRAFSISFIYTSNSTAPPQNPGKCNGLRLAGAQKQRWLGVQR